MKHAAVTEWLTRPGGIVEQLVALRTRADLLAKDLAAELGWHPSKISRIEGGSQVPSASDLREWARACSDPGAADSLLTMLDEVQSVRIAWRHRIARGDKQIQVDHDTLGRKAEVIRNFEVSLVPGLLQIRPYTRAVISAGYGLHRIEPDLPAIIAEREKRQTILYSEPAKQFEFIVDEPVLRRAIAPPQVMRAQLDRLVSVTSLDNVRFGVIPLGAPITVAPNNSFVIYDNLAIAEDFAREQSYDADDAALHAQVMDHLWSEAVEGDDARRIIIRSASELR